MTEEQYKEHKLRVDEYERRAGRVKALEEALEASRHEQAYVVIKVAGFSGIEKGSTAPSRPTWCRDSGT